MLRGEQIRFRFVYHCSSVHNGNKTFWNCIFLIICLVTGKSPDFSIILCYWLFCMYKNEYWLRWFIWKFLIFVLSDCCQQFQEWYNSRSSFWWRNLLSVWSPLFLSKLAQDLNFLCKYNTTMILHTRYSNPRFLGLIAMYSACFIVKCYI